MQVKDAIELGKVLELEAPEVGVEVAIRGDGGVLWVNVDGVCVLRICRIKTSIDVCDARESKTSTTTGDQHHD